MAGLIITLEMYKQVQCIVGYFKTTKLRLV